MRALFQKTQKQGPSGAPESLPPEILNSFAESALDSNPKITKYENDQFLHQGLHFSGHDLQIEGCRLVRGSRGSRDPRQKGLQRVHHPSVVVARFVPRLFFLPQRGLQSRKTRDESVTGLENRRIIFYGLAPL